MELFRRKSAQGVRHVFIGQFQRFVYGFSLDHFCGHGAGGDGRSAAKGLKLYILYDFVFVDVEKNLHHISAARVPHFAYSVSILKISDITRVHKIIHYFFGVNTHLDSLLSLLCLCPTFYCGFL